MPGWHMGADTAMAAPIRQADQEDLDPPGHSTVPELPEHEVNRARSVNKAAALLTEAPLAEAWAPS